MNRLAMNELENISGGKESVYWVPPTHEEIDAVWDMIESVFKTAGRDAALVLATSLNVFSGADSEFSTGDVRQLSRFRNRMHREIDGKLTDFDCHGIH